MSFHVESLADRLARHARETPYGMAFRFLSDGELQAEKWSYAKLYRTASRIASHLRRIEATGQRVLLLYPPGPDYIAAFFGCLVAGAVAVPAYPPEPDRLTRTVPRLTAILKDSGATVALTIESVQAIAESMLSEILAAQGQALHWVATDTLETGEPIAPEPVRGSDVAFLQYTSGSTTTPRGVMVTHGNLLHNISAIQARVAPFDDFSGVSWLPPYHDMGLIGGILAPLHAGLPITLLSPLDFLKRPIRWLEAMTRYRGTVSPAPNFAYDLCVRKVTPEQRSHLDLSSWRATFDGAEPVDAAVIDRFTEAFGSCGFRRDAFLTCYGLAESTLIATGTPPRTEPRVRTLDPAALSEGRVLDAPRQQGRRLVSSGRPIDGLEIAIVDPQTGRRCPEARIGEIWLRGPSVAAGYWNRADETAATFLARIADDESGPFLRTGDLGVLLEGELFVTGRIKDVIIQAGANHYPQDIERTVESTHPAVRPGASAAFGVSLDGRESIVVVCETDDPRSGERADEIRTSIRRAVNEQHQLGVHTVILLRKGAIPRTSSGKVQRFACRDGFLNQTLDAHDS